MNKDQFGVGVTGTTIATLAFTILVCLVILYCLNRLSPYRQSPKQNDNKPAMIAIIGSLFFVATALIFSIFTNVHPLSTVALSPMALVQSVITLIPMLIMLTILKKTTHPHFTAFREKQIEVFSKIGFRFTPMRIFLMSLGAGIGEEMLFRGALQGWLSEFSPIIIAIILPAMIFGALHNANLTYMVIASLIGVYLGVSFVITDNIAVPIIAHALYDIIALHSTSVLIVAREQGNTQS